jgi:hypothetical protein
MKKYHVHIYKVPEKAEIDVEVKNVEEIGEIAFDKADKGKLKFKKNDEGEYTLMYWEV